MSAFFGTARNFKLLTSRRHFFGIRCRHCRRARNLWATEGSHQRHFSSPRPASHSLHFSLSSLLIDFDRGRIISIPALRSPHFILPATMASSASAFLGSTLTHLRGLGLGAEVDDDGGERGHGRVRRRGAVRVLFPKGSVSYFPNDDALVCNSRGGDVKRRLPAARGGDAEILPGMRASGRRERRRIRGGKGAAGEVWLAAPA